MRNVHLLLELYRECIGNRNGYSFGKGGMFGSFGENENCRLPSGLV